MRGWVGLAALGVGATAVSAAAQTAQADAAIFGARQSMLSFSLAPSGKKMAYIGPAGPHGEIIYVVDLSGGHSPQPIMAATETDSTLERCDWATEDRLVCQLYILQKSPDGLVGSTRLFSIDSNGKNLVILSQRPRDDAYGIMQNGGDIIALDDPRQGNSILMSHQWLAEFSTATLLGNTQTGLGVDEVDVATGKATKLEGPVADAVDYIADERGRIRLRVRQKRNSDGYLLDQRSYQFRPEGSGQWKSIDQLAGSDFIPRAVSAAQGLVYGFQKIDGKEAVVSYTLEGGAQRQILAKRDDVDVDELIRLGRSGRVVGASYATDRRTIVYFDKPMAQLAASLQKALPGNPMISIVDASADENTLLLVASSDTDPGQVYLFDKRSNELSPVLPLRAQLKDRALAPMKPVTYAASDGTHIPGYLTLPTGSSGKGLPAIVLPHGGPGSRDEWGFDWLVQYFAARGYAVMQPNFRGSAGYGDEWFGNNGFQAWRTAVGDVDDAGRWLISQGIADPAKLAIVGWSYGGYAALQSQVLDPQLFKAVVAIAPVTDLELLRGENRNYTNFRLVRDFVGTGPHLEEGSPARHAKTFVAPVLLFHGTFDQNVSVQHSQLMRDRLQAAGKPVKYVEFAGIDHYIENGAMRSTMLSDIDQFLAASLKR